MPNLIAQAALWFWPFACVALFAVLPRQRAIVWSIIGSFILLPASYGIDLPGVPPLDKVSVPAITLFAILLVTEWQHFKVVPISRIATMLLGFVVIGAFVTALLNQDPVRLLGQTARVPGLTPYDALSDVIRTMIGLIPFIVGRCFLASAESHRDILRVLFVAGLAYTLPMLIEIRLSPQIHIWVYGYFPHSFAQQVRQGGFRPVVFFKHGLWLAFFAMSATVAAALIWKSLAGQSRQLYLLATVYMLAVLYLANSLGALVFALVFVPIAMLTMPRTQLKIAAVLALVAVAYPALRGADLVPTDRLVAAADSISAARAQSLDYRFENEELLLERAEERPLFGWGGFGRNRVYDPETGEDLSTTDGLWIIQIGTSGWIGYAGYFGLLSLPIFALLVSMRRGAPIEPATAGLCLLVAINLIEILPNSTLPPWTWLMAGALLGHAERPGLVEGNVKVPQRQRYRVKTIL